MDYAGAKPCEDIPDIDDAGPARPFTEREKAGFLLMARCDNLRYKLDMNPRIVPPPVTALEHCNEAFAIVNACNAATADIPMTKEERFANNAATLGMYIRMQVDEIMTRDAIRNAAMPAPVDAGAGGE